MLLTSFLMLLTCCTAWRSGWIHPMRSLSAYAWSRSALCAAGDEDSMVVEKASRWVQPGHVYFVATPLGNIHDMSSRAIDVLAQVDVICAEDTRNTVQLLRLLGIPVKKVISHHDHNQVHSIPGVLELIRAGHSIAVVSDAGTPGISDPGTGLAAQLPEGIAHPIPGPCAMAAALSICGFPATEMTFLAFIPVKGKERKDKLALLASIPHTQVFYEAPHRIQKTFADLVALGPDVSSRMCLCCRELTKRHEQSKRGTVTEILAWLQLQEANKENGQGVGIKGEFTVVLGPSPAPSMKEQWQTVRDELASDDIQPEPINTATSDDKDLKSMVTAALEGRREAGMKRSQAAREVAQQLNAPKSVVYDMALKLPWR